MLSTRQVLVSSPFVVAALVSAGFLTAQDSQVRNDSGAVQTYRAKEILGSKVALQGGNSVGTVDDIVVDSNGNVDYLVVINQDNQLVTVPFDVAAFNVQKRVATVQITPERFKQVPTYTTQAYPLYATPAYRTEIYKYYGATPGQTRRAIRHGALIAE